MVKKFFKIGRVVLLVSASVTIVSLPFVLNNKTPDPTTKAQENAFTTTNDIKIPSTNTTLTQQAQGLSNKLIAGTGLSITGNTLNNIDLGSSQSIFKNIHVDSQDSIIAAVNNDSLTFVASDGISITTDPTNNNLTIKNTITSSDINGWSTSNDLVKLSDASNDVSIGGSSSLGKLSLFGTEDEKQLVIRAVSGQTNNLLELQDNSGNTLARFDKDGDLILATEKTISLTADKSTSGSISRLITLNATSQYDRPWISSIDHNDRHVAAHGTHAINYDDSTTHNKWELKTSADPGGATPDAMLTRIAVEYDSDLSDIIFGDIDTIGVHNDYGDRIEFVANMQDSGGTAYDIGQWITELGAGDGTVMSFDVITLDTSKDATLRFFRETNTTGQRRLVVYEGDGTATETFSMEASTGRIRVHTDDEVAFWGSGNNSTAYNNFQSNRTMVGYDGSNATIQGGTSKGIKLNVNSSSFGQGTAMYINSSGQVGIGTTDPDAFFHVEQNGLAATFGDQSNTSAYLDFQSTRGRVGYDGSYMVLQGGNSKGVKLNVNNSSFGAGTAVTIETSGDVGIGVAPTLGPLELANGAYVTTGGAWQNGSDRNSKTNFKEIDNDLILEKIIALPITEWNYITESSSVRHIGPMAQDFSDMFGVGNNNTSISTIDPAGIALVGIQSLFGKIEKLEAKIDTLHQEIENRNNQEEASFIEKLMTFVSQVVFKNRVFFEKAPSFAKNSAGKALVKQGSDFVRITFNEAYPTAPQVTLSEVLTNEDQAIGQTRYAIKELSEYGFTIQLNEATHEDISFSWIAIMVDEPETFVGDEKTSDEDTNEAEVIINPTIVEQTKEETLESSDASLSAKTIEATPSAELL